MKRNQEVVEKFELRQIWKKSHQSQIPHNSAHRQAGNNIFKPKYWQVNLDFWDASKLNGRKMRSKSKKNINFQTEDKT